MQIAGTGFTTFQAKIKPDFIPATTLALTWFQLANGGWAATDRGVAQDSYDSPIRLYGLESDMLAFVTAIEANRTAGSNVLTLSGFNSQEHIFGADVNYGVSILATAIMERRGQKTWRGFEQPLTLSAVSPAFVGGSGFLPVFTFLDVGYDGDSDYTINKFSSYNRTFSFQDHSADFGSFSGVFTFTNEEMTGLRRYVASVRSGNVPMPTFSGVKHPFARRSPSTNVKIIAFEDMGMIELAQGLPRWKAKLTFAEAF